MRNDPLHGGITIQVWQALILSSVVHFLSEAMRSDIPQGPPVYGFHLVVGVATLVHEDHASSSTFLKHLNSQVVLPTDTTILRFSALHAVSTIIVNEETVVDVQLAAVIGDNGKAVHALARDD